MINTRQMVNNGNSHEGFALEEVPSVKRLDHREDMI